MGDGERDVNSFRVVEDSLAGAVVKSFPRAEWELLSPTEQREYFSQYNIHVKGKPATEILPDVFDLDSTEGISRAIDLEKPLFCHSELIRDKNWQGF